jgi:hypothetical protein
MSDMTPLAKVISPAERTPQREACDRAFDLVCRYSRGQGLVEEMVASNFWPPRKRKEAFHIEMVQVPVFGPVEGLPLPRFDRVLPPDQDKKAFILEIEECAHQIVGKMSDKEYLARRSASGTMPRLNRVLEEFGIHHEEYLVPPNVLATIEEKKRKAAAKNVTAVAELKKRKGMAGPKALAKKLKTSTAVIIPIVSSAESSAHASASAREGADGTGEGRADSIPEVDKPALSTSAGGSRGLEGVELAEPSVANPLPNVMGGDSNSEDAKATGCRAPSPPKEMEAREMSRRRPVAVEVSDDEANSEPVARLQSATYR